MFDLNTILRPNIRNLQPYSSARSEFSGSDVILLDANENPFAPDGLPEGVNRYPDPLQWEVKKKLSTIKGVDPENIFLGNGSDEAIDLVIRCFCKPGEDAIAVFSPTYGMYRVCAAVNDVAVVDYPLDENFMINDNFTDRLAGNVKVIFICNPNNPSGNLQSNATIEKILNSFKGVVVIDEAYIDFCPGQSFVSKLGKYPNLIILQTLSKAWALAGARIGIALASKEIIEVLSRVKYPYNVGRPSLRIAGQVLENNGEMQKQLQLIVDERKRLTSLLPKLPGVVRVYPSEANFILVKTNDALGIYNHLTGNGIVVRNRDRETGCKGCLRVTVGTCNENDRLISAWQEYKPK
jgi:histidinol-phosphate aminotransferase